MGKNKLRHLAELETFPNVFQLRRDLKGEWNESVFKNQNPIILELACGKGEYAVALAKKYPEKNFIGIDIKGARIWRGAKTALEEKITNVVFIRTFIDHIEEYFSEEEVEEIWITFPDPYLKKSKARKRLTSKLFLERYKTILRSTGIIHLKTDDLQLYQFSLETIYKFKGSILFSSADLYSQALPDEILNTKTYYEQQHLAEGKAIKYIKFTLPDQ